MAKKTAQKRDGVYQRALLEACLEGLRQIVALVVLTGMRRGEIINLRYLDVDLANRRIMLPQTKNGEGRIIYLNNMAAMVFRSVGWNAETTPGDRIFSRVTDFEWRPVRDLNPCCRRERAMSWTGLDERDAKFDHSAMMSLACRDEWQIILTMARFVNRVVAFVKSRLRSLIGVKLKM
jgi:Phage integrase family